MPLNISTGPPGRGAPAPPNAISGMIWIHNGQIVIYNGTQWIPLGNGTEEEPMAEFRVSHKAHNVNTKRLLKKITTAVEEVVVEYVIQRTSTLSRTYDFSQLLAYLELLMQAMQEDKEITVYNVVGDHRNNDSTNVMLGLINIDVYFQQFNCLNITKIALNLERI